MTLPFAINPRTGPRPRSCANLRGGARTDDLTRPGQFAGLDSLSTGTAETRVDWTCGTGQLLAIESSRTVFTFAPAEREKKKKTSGARPATTKRDDIAGTRPLIKNSNFKNGSAAHSKFEFAEAEVEMFRNGVEWPPLIEAVTVARSLSEPPSRRGSYTPAPSNPPLPKHNLASPPTRNRRSVGPPRTGSVGAISSDVRSEARRIHLDESAAACSFIECDIPDIPISGMSRPRRTQPLCAAQSSSLV
ncbi:unnamed protein product, partial [Iphiclides podalirius]